jgi:Glycosyl hydrolases family 15
VVGGERNWDYRFCWVRDAAFMLGALLRLGRVDEADAFFWWLMQASQLTHPRLRVLYRLDGGPRPVNGRCRSLATGDPRPSGSGTERPGSSSSTSTAIFSRPPGSTPRQAGRSIPISAAGWPRSLTWSARIWPERDAGLWEVRSGPQHFTQSKMMCFVALDRALRLARAGRIPSRHATRWQEEANAIRDFIEEHCWSQTMQSYVRHADTGELRREPAPRRALPVRRARRPKAARHRRGHPPGAVASPFVYRYSDEDGLAGKEGAFLTCSFSLAEALAVQGRRTEAADLMEQLIGLANDVGLFAKEVDPSTGAFLGNLPPGPDPPGPHPCRARLQRGGWTMSLWGALAGGLAGTLVLTTVLRAASEARLTRIDLPFLLGTAVTANRGRAKAVGYLAHFGFGLIFALICYGLFSDRPQRVGTRRHLRVGPRSVLGDRAGEHPATNAAPPHGHAVHRRRLLPAHRGARLPDAQFTDAPPP